MSRPLQVYFDDAEARALDVWARERGWTKSDAVRVAVRALLRQPDDDSIMGLSGMVHGLPRELSKTMARHLAESHVAETAPAYGRPRRRVRR